MRTYLYTRLVRVLESFGKLWKFVMSFPISFRQGKLLNWKSFQNVHEKALDFCMGKFYNILKFMQFTIIFNTVYVMFVYLAIYYIMPNQDM